MLHWASAGVDVEQSSGECAVSGRGEVESDIAGAKSGMIRNKAKGFEVDLIGGVSP